MNPSPMFLGEGFINSKSFLSTASPHFQHQPNNSGMGSLRVIKRRLQSFYPNFKQFTPQKTLCLRARSPIFCSHSEGSGTVRDISLSRLIDRYLKEGSALYGLPSMR